MSNFRLLPGLAFLACLLGGCANDAGPTGTASKKTAPAIAGHLFPVLTKGMSAAEVRQKLGAPAEIKPMEAPVGKAEVWVYHFEETVGMEQVASGLRDVPSFGMGSFGSTNITQQEAVYTTVAKKAKVTLSLLMFDGKLTAQKAAVEKSSDYTG